MKFEVTGHDEMPERGAFVLGLIHGEGFRPGVLVRSVSNQQQTYAVAGVESISGSGTHMSALVFRERPSMPDIVHAFPVGSMICAVSGSSAGAT
jgi:hypothetical protein